MAADATSLATATPAAPAGDILSIYPKVVATFVVMRLTCWIVLFLEVSGVVGPVGYAIVQAGSAMEITYCQLMFFGTLHRGLVSSNRLEWICRVTFVVDGVALLVRGFTVFRPDTVVELLQAENATANGLAVDMAGSIQGGIIWFVAMALFSMWIGVQLLAVSRIRIHSHTESLSDFSTRNTRIYCAALVVQLLLGVLLVVYTLSNDATPEQKVRARKTVNAVVSFSMAIGQAYTFKMFIFNSGGQTISGYLRGDVGANGRKGTIHKTVAIVLTLCWFGVVTLGAIFALAATSTTDGFEYQTLAMDTLQLQIVFQFSPWAVFCHDMGMNRTHLCNVAKGEERFAQFRDARVAQKP